MAIVIQKHTHTSVDSYTLTLTQKMVVYGNTFMAMCIYGAHNCWKCFQLKLDA